MKFDWYQASIPEVDPGLILDVLDKSDYYGQWEEQQPLKGYSFGAQFVIGDQVRFTLNHGGTNAEYGANVMATGGNAPILAEILRDKFSVHKISRVDVCEDYYHKDVYKYLRKKALKVAREGRVQVREIVKPLPESDDGRTLYLGSEKSAISFRLYEKGKQLELALEWIRAELQARPKKGMKDILSHLKPEDIWGVCKWSHALAKQLGNKNLQRVESVIYQPSDHERTRRFMLYQYRKVFERMLGDHGTWEAVGAQIGYDIEHGHEEFEKTFLSPLK